MSAEAGTRGAPVAADNIWVGVGWALTAVAIWAGWMVASRLGVTTGELNAWDITALRYGFAGMLMLPVVLRRGLGVGPRGWPGAIVLSICAGAPYALLAIGGFAFAPVAHGALSPSFVPLFTALIAAWLLGEVLSARRLMGFALVFVGVGLVVWRSLVEAGPGEVGAWRGDAMFLTSGLMWAIYTVSVRHWRVDALHATAVTCVLAMLAYLPLYLVFAGERLLQLPVADMALQAVYQGGLTQIAALWCHARAISILGAGRAAVFASMVPALATLAAIPILGEYPAVTGWVGIVVLTVGILVAVGARLKPRPPT